MSNELRHIVEQLRQDLSALADRLNDLERDHLKVRQRVPVPFEIPTRSLTKVALLVSLALTMIALALVMSPHSITVGGVLYNWPGIPAEAIASLGAGVGVLITLREHLKDKDDYRGRDD